ncbi:uncharacterized protein LOC143036685 isoform X1 [Oratosquilla oratoria]|uniref:uncharacterized protein LOC143036685 isoform X1 n=1 Tax=Oratosquilla oratoria TaxID=337810 RepID=UPI003F7572AE
MISVQELKEQAIALGLAGGDIGKYVIEQQAIEREEREKERRAKKEEIEHKTRLAEIEAEKAKIEAEREKAKIEAEKEKAKIEAEKELELARITATKQPTATPHDSVSRPQLPLLQEGEDIASYLNRFERIAELLKLSSDSYAVRLGTLLTGKAADMYISLSPEITKNYELLKKALLSGFNKTPDGYRVDFRNAKISPGETFLQFSFQLTRLFQAWLDSSEVGNTFNDLKDFMILDQFLSSLHPDLRAFIKERRPSTLTEAIRLADDWTSAHPNLPRTSIPNAKKFSRPPKPPKVTTATPNPSSGRKDSPPLTCHGCGEIGHIRPRCPRNPRTFKEGTSTTQPYKVGFCLSDRTVPHFQASGTINGAWVSTIIRDTGCSCVVVSDEMLPDIDVPSCKKVYVADYLGRVDAFPLVSCYLRCPYYEGWTDVVRAPIKFASVLIGNVPGVKDPNISECSSPADDSAIPRPTQTATPSPKHLVCAVQTRAGKMKRIHPLALPALQPLSVTPDNFSLLQSSCETLSAARAKAASGEIDRTRNGSTYQFVKTDGLLYRKCLTSNRPDKASDYTGPLSDLLRKTSPEPLPWTEDLLDRFCHLKAAISSQPILRLPDPKLTFVLRTDASLYGLGAVLLQYHDECPHPVAYASRKLLDREKRYSTIERECLAVVFSISRFDYYLRGKEFVLEVDHKPLLYLATFKGKNDRLLRWALALQAYKFRVVHIAGKDNLGADLLSRS